MNSLPKALVCGLLEDNGRALFLKRVDGNRNETIELPCFPYFSGDPVKQLAENFLKQTGIDAEARETAFEAKHNAGSRRRKQWVPCLVFRMRAKAMHAKPAAGFSGCVWLPLREAKSFLSADKNLGKRNRPSCKLDYDKQLKLSRNAEWLARM